MDRAGTSAAQSGITAVLALAGRQVDLDSAILDLAAVLDGLAGNNFEILVAEAAPDPRTTDLLDGLRARYPGLPLRSLEDWYADPGSALAAGFNAASRELILVASPGQDFEVSECNHLLEAIEQGADLALGRQADRTTTLQRLQRRCRALLKRALSGDPHQDAGCVFSLVRRSVWQAVSVQPRGSTARFCGQLLARARQLGYCIAEVPLGQVRPAQGAGPRPATRTVLQRRLAPTPR